MIKNEDNQEEEKEVSELVLNSKVDDLEAKLEEANSQLQNNKAAADILSGMIEKGELVQNPDGSVEVVNDAASS